MAQSKIISTWRNTDMTKSLLISREIFLRQAENWKHNACSFMLLFAIWNVQLYNKIHYLFFISIHNKFTNKGIYNMLLKPLNLKYFILLS